MITEREYFTNPTTGVEKPHTEEQAEAARVLLGHVEDLKQDYYAATGRGPDIDPDTGTEISGKRHGTGAGGYREEHEPGSDDSSHKIRKPKAGAGIDVSDQDNGLDNWLSTFDREGGTFNDMLEKHKLYREAPEHTGTWAHLTTRLPWSGRRTFTP